MPKTAPKSAAKKRKLRSYEHRTASRVNNPPVGLVTPATDPDAGQMHTYQHDPHLDPQLQWAGKAENTAVQVPTQSLHVHECIDARTILEQVRQPNGNGAQARLFENEKHNRPLREAVEFYKHENNWSNRLIAGDSLLVMNSLLQKENLTGRVQMIYMDPPYGIEYNSNFQPFINKREVKDGAADDLTREPEMIKAFRDTWELGIHSYLTYMRDRLLLARELLTDTGSCFVQISDENVHLIRNLMDEIFGVKNFVNQIGFRTSMTKPTTKLNNVFDYIVWYAKDKENYKFRPLFAKRQYEDENEIVRLETVSARQPQAKYAFEFEGKTYTHKNGWRVAENGMRRLAAKGRLCVTGNTLSYIRYAKDFPCLQLDNIWAQQMSQVGKMYTVQTNEKPIQRCMLMTTDPGDLVFDPTCGSGTTAYVAEQWGRRWITCDTSRIATTLAKTRLMTANFDYYKLAYEEEVIGGGFQYKTVPHITLKSIANNEPPATEILYDQPLVDNKRVRITGPFTVEAVPSPTVISLEEAAGMQTDAPSDAETTAQPAAQARRGETVRQAEWRDELLNSGIRGKNGQRIAFSSVELSAHRYVHATAETKPDDGGAAHKPQRAAISFGGEHAPLEQRQVEAAWQEAQTLTPRPDILVFAAFQFDPEAAKDIDEMQNAGMTLLKVQMNADLQTADLQKNRARNDSFWLVGQPDVSVTEITAAASDDGDGATEYAAARYQVRVNGFDYFNVKSGKVESGGDEKIAMWLLDTNYDRRALYPRQVFFPMADANGGWEKLAKNLRAEIDHSKITAYRGTKSLPFTLGKHQRIAVKIIDDRGIESLKVVEMEGEKGYNPK